MVREQKTISQLLHLRCQTKDGKTGAQYQCCIFAGRCYCDRRNQLLQSEDLSDPDPKQSSTGGKSLGRLRDDDGGDASFQELLALRGLPLLH